MAAAENRKKQREEQQILLREKKREELLNRKRTTAVDDDVSGIVDFKVKKELLLSKNPEKVLDGVIKFRKNLSVEQRPPIQAIIDSGLVPRFVELLSSSCVLYTDVEYNLVKKIRSEAAWALTNVASGSSEQTQKILDFGAIPLFADMLRENDEELVDQAAWAFGNISGDSEIMRDAAINCGVLKTAIQLSKSLAETNASLRVLKNTTWLISNLNRGLNPPPKYENMVESLEVLQKLIDHPDDDVKNDALWAISYICDNEPKIVKLVFALGIVDKVISFLENYQHYSTTKIMHPAIRTIGNIITSTDEYVDTLINKGIVTLCYKVFREYPGEIAIKKLRKEICWTFSNIACGTENHINHIMTSEILTLLYSTSTLQNYIKLEACWALTNMMKFTNTNWDHFEVCLSGPYFKFMNDCLESFDTYRQIRIHILTTTKKLIFAARDWQVSKTGTNKLIETKRFNNITDLIETIETLQYEDDNEVKMIAEHICAEYEKDDIENENVFR